MMTGTQTHFVSGSIWLTKLSLMAEWLGRASQGHEMYCHDFKLQSSYQSSCQNHLWIAITTVSLHFKVLYFLKSIILTAYFYAILFMELNASTQTECYVTFKKLLGASVLCCLMTRLSKDIYDISMNITLSYACKSPD